MNILCTHIQSTNGLFCTGYLATSRSYRETLQAKLIDERTFIMYPHPSAQCCVLTNSSPLGVGQAPVENSWGTYKIKNVAQKKLA